MFLHIVYEEFVSKRCLLENLKKYTLHSSGNLDITVSANYFYELKNALFD